MSLKKNPFVYSGLLCNMNVERDEILDFLKDFPVTDLKDALKVYKKLEKDIFVAGNKKYTIKIIGADEINSVNVSTISVEKENISYGCGCDRIFKTSFCKHVALAAIKLLVSKYLMSFGHIELLLTVGNENFPKDDIWVNTHKEQVVPETYAKQLSLLGEEDWKSFSSSPKNVFSTVYSIDYKSATRENIKCTSLLEVDKNENIFRFLYKKNKANIFHPQIKYNRYSLFHYTCDCAENRQMCSHVKAAFEFLLQSNGRDVFNDLRNRDEEKNALLKPYGITLKDKEAADFIFKEDYRDMLTVTPPSWFWKGELDDKIVNFKHFLLPDEASSFRRPMVNSMQVIDFEVGLLFNFNSQHFKIGLEVEPVKLYAKGGKETFKKLSIHNAENLPLLVSLPDDVYEALLNLSDDGVKKHMLQQGHLHMYNYAAPYQQMSDKDIAALRHYYYSEVIKTWPLLSKIPYTYKLVNGSFSSTNILPIKLSTDPITFSFQVSTNQNHITISMNTLLNGVIVPNEKVNKYQNAFFEIDGALYAPQDAADLEMLKQFSHGFIKIPTTAMQQVISNMIPLLQKKYEVAVPETMSVDRVSIEPVFQVHLKEMDNKFLLIHPQFYYDDVLVNYEPKPDNIFRSFPDGSYKVIERNTALEKNHYDSIKALHPNFQKPTMNNYFFLNFDETMKNNWFIEAIRYLNENNITVVGILELKKHRYNANPGKWEMKAGSGIDWFDLKIEISFGDQVVALRDVRKAMMNKQSVVVLGDGTFGVLPEEWLKQFGMLLKMGEEQKDGSLRVNKLHYTLIDELHSQIKDEDIIREINDKKQRLLNIGDFKTVKPSKEIKATLRPYQLHGFQWLQTLDEMGWGGCLADDMGLGKTLQAITFLQFLKGKYKASTHLVICPTSLIYNWESELQKFAPKIKYHIYYGNERAISEEHFNDFDVIITSYGVLRNDLEDLMQFEWHYIILDESQAIKNPDAQTNKALQLMKSKNRVILSGTPIQNNTFDLFAQFHFINPGLLGNRDFFKSEFANPIDKNNDNEKSAQLRRLIFPFMLRRTKEQVATDLPDKTETILWCEMAREQRAVYNDYKNYYRTSLLEKIEEVGMAKAGMYVLEGLLRLRQICDSPVLVKDNEVTTTQSTKINELMREIEENAGGHKILIFSQFTEMLHLIEDELIKEKVNYVYLDGSTPAEKRKEAVEKFQGDTGVRVFLISLKAGGVGLNLTAADYVYIVDPWWNPAVEQQAIDRTHRIGQQNKIFAYKMICKDTVEEKIVLLQQKKKQLANDLVTEDAGFIKKLNKDDIAFLFS